MKAIIIPTMTLLGVSGRADENLTRNERRRGVVGAGAMAEAMVRDDDGGKVQGGTMMEGVVMGEEVEGIAMLPPGLDTRVNSTQLWRSLGMHNSKHLSTPSLMGNIPNPSRKRRLPPIPV